MPPELVEALLQSFVALSDSYIESCDALAPRLDGTSFEDALWRGRPQKYAFAAMRARIADVLLPRALEVVETFDAGEDDGDDGDAAAGSPA